MNSFIKKVTLPHVFLLTKHTTQSLVLLVDTGSSASLVKQESLYKKPQLSTEIVRLKAINDSGTYCETLGTFQMQFYLSLEVFSYKFHVVKDVSLDYDCIIGTDCLGHLKAVIDYDKECLTMNNHTLPLRFKLPIYKIPARSEAVIECGVSNNIDDLPFLKEALVLDHQIFEGVYVANCIVTLKPNCRVNVSILNTAESEIEVNNYSGYLTPIREQPYRMFDNFQY
ncbi:unnamed protein product [Euphydryas editha]|uniref:Peptidase A2 domain-containing protein n=1 Tax=Euphydryas editha TaxID=104508 RepID=A0AAU9UJU2_EUPED|nr:unnamed protein product [Euphydryas editha]